jgi:sugar lactone lactonase YvrE
VKGLITTFAGAGTLGPNDWLSDPQGVAVDLSGNVYIADSANNRIRMVAPTGVIATIAGNGVVGYNGDGGAATNARLNYPVAVAVDSGGNFYVSDSDNNVVRRVDVLSGIITTVAGSGTPGYLGDGGPATSAELNQPGGIAVDAAGNLYIADTMNNSVRVVNASSGNIGSINLLNKPTGVAVDSNSDLYIANDGGATILRLAAAQGSVITVAGNGTHGYSGDAGLATSAELYQPWGVTVDAGGNFFIADWFSNRVRKVTASTGIITTVAGTGTPGYSGDNGEATSAKIYNPVGVAVDANGNLYIADVGNNRIRMVTAP